MSWMRRLANLLRSNEHSRDLDRELAFHLEERVDDLVATGMSPAAARDEARRRFGNYGAQKENARDVDVLTWLDSIADDVRYAVRALRQSRAFALVAILSLALGIGANTAIFTLIDAVMLRSLPVSHPDELVQLTMGPGDDVFTNPIWEALRDRQDVFTGAFAYSRNAFNLSVGGPVRTVDGNLVSGDFFRTLGLHPALGRLLSTADDQRGCAPVAVLSDAFWRSEYGADPEVLGRSISLGAHAFRIVGVLRPGFDGMNVGESSKVYAPLCADLVLHGAENALDRRSNWWLWVIARPRSELSREQVRARLAGLAPGIFESTTPQRWQPDRQSEYRKRGLDVASAANGLSNLRQEYRKALMALMGIVVLVLLIACANVANLLLARAAVRQREMAVRVALGAARRRIVRQLLTESLLLSLTGTALGLVLARWGSRLLVRFLSSSQSAITLDLHLDARVLLFSIAAALVTGIAFGLVPAWRAARVDPNAALKANARGVVEGQRRFTLGKALVVAQIAVSLTLIVGAGLLLRTFNTLATLDPGFSASNVLLVTLGQPRPGTVQDEGAVVGAAASASAAAQLAVHQAALARLRGLPGVTSASLSQYTPLSRSSWNEEMLVDGFTPASFEDGLAYFNEVSDGYFASLAMPLIGGRDFDASDRLGAPLAAVVNETMARRFYRTTNPIGRTFRYQTGAHTAGPFIIVGVVKDAKYLTLREKTRPTVFVPISQDSGVSRYITAVVRTSRPPASMMTAVKDAVTELNPAISMRFTTFAAQIDDSLQRERLLATLSGFFGALALLLATMGLYGVMSYNVARRRNEIGIRMALGAGQRRVAAMVLGEVGMMLGVGLAVGVVLALACTRLIASFLYGMTSTDVATFGGSMGLLAVVALVAAYVPARRAARVDPMDALRE